MRHLYLFTLLCVMHLVFSSQLQAQAPSAAFKGQVYAAETYCTPHGPESKINELPPTVTVAEAEKHEEIHRRQMRDLGCEHALVLWEQDARVWIVAEAQAACLAMRSVGLDARERYLRYVDLTKWWMRWGNTRLAYAEIAGAYSAWCDD